jgi:spermidine synthase
MISPYVLDRNKDKFPVHILSLFSLFFPLTFLLILFLPSTTSVRIWIFYGLASTPPFILMGAIAAYLYARLPEKSGMLYAFDLCGAALGTLMAIPGMNLLGPIKYSVLLCLFVMAVSMAVSYVEEKRFETSAVVAGILSVLLFIIVLIPGSNRVIDRLIFNRTVPGKGLFSQISGQTGKIEERRWNAISRLDVVSSTDYPSKFIYIDGQVPATMFQYDTNKVHMDRYLRHFICYAPFTYGKNEKVLSIGCGAGMDCLVGVLGGAKRITAVEVNRELIDIVRQYSLYNGGMFSLPGVTVKVAEGRSFVRSTTEKYDVILFYLAQGNPAEARGRVMLEDYLMTQEAFKDYYDHLNPGGKIAIACHNPHRTSRHLMGWAAMLRERGISLSGAVRRFALLSYPDAAYRFLLIFHRDLPDTVEMAKLRSFTDSTEANAIFLPFIWEEDKDLGGMAQGRMTKEMFIHTSPMGIDINPVSDNKPFQNNVYKGIHPGLALLIKMALISLGAIVLIPLIFLNLSGQRVRFFTWEIYFALLGIGFMVVEVVFMRRMMLYLGYPALALSVILFSILVGAGLGGMAGQRLISAGRDIKLFGVLIILAVLFSFYLFLSIGIMDTIMGKHIALRSIAAIVILLVPAFFMGMPFPFGMALASKQISGSSTWMWGINGVASVAGSVIATVVSLLYGMHMAVWGAAVIYGGAGIMFLTVLRKR